MSGLLPAADGSHFAFSDLNVQSQFACVDMSEGAQIWNTSVALLEFIMLTLLAFPSLCLFFRFTAFKY